MKLIIKIGTIIIVFLGGISYVNIQSHYYDKGLTSVPPRYVIVLGAEIEGVPGKTIPGVILRDRLNRALEYRTRYPNVKFILSGLGVEADTKKLGSEANTMKQYLVSRGVSGENLIIENRSRDTFQNLSYSKKKILPRNSRVTIITSDFHMARALMLAKKLRINAVGYSAHTTEISTRSNLAREILAFWSSLIFNW